MKQNGLSLTEPWPQDHEMILGTITFEIRCQSLQLKALRDRACTKLKPEDSIEV